MDLPRSVSSFITKSKNNNSEFNKSFKEVVSDNHQLTKSNHGAIFFRLFKDNKNYIKNISKTNELNEETFKKCQKAYDAQCLKFEQTTVVFEKQKKAYNVLKENISKALELSKLTALTEEGLNSLNDNNTDETVDETVSEAVDICEGSSRSIANP